MRYFYILFLVFFALTSFSLTIEARRGCCSWHGGVAGCDSNSGYLVCRDSTRSPSCRCGE